MADEARWDPLLPAVGCKPRPRERLWTLMKNGKRVDAELLFHGEHGVEIQFLHEGVMAYGRRWTLKRGELESQGWVAAVLV